VWLVRELRRGKRGDGRHSRAIWPMGPGRMMASIFMKIVVKLESIVFRLPIKEQKKLLIPRMSDARLGEEGESGLG